MKKHIKKMIALFFMLFGCYCVVDAVIEVRQEIFPIKAEEIRRIDISLPNDAYDYPDGWQTMDQGKLVYHSGSVRDKSLNDVTTRDAITAMINELSMKVDDAAKQEMVADFRMSPYEKRVLAEVHIRYTTDYLQRKQGTTFYFYDDGRINVYEHFSTKRPLIIRFLNQWNQKNWENFTIYAAADLEAYHTLIATLQEYCQDGETVLQPTKKGTIETFTYNDLKLQISNVHSVRTETYMDPIDETYQWERTIYTYYPGAELTVLNADMLETNGEAKAQWKISRISEAGVPYVPSASIDIIDYAEPLPIMIEMDGIYHYESMIKVLMFEPYQENK
jgi:hypothetical protein